MKLGNWEIKFGKVSNEVQPQKTRDLRDKISYEQQLHRIRQDVGRWRQATIAAESVDFPNRKMLLELYNDIMLDATLKALIENRKEIVLGKNWQFVDDAGNVDEALTRELLTSKWFNDFNSLALDSKYWGFSWVQFLDRQTDGFKGVELIPRQNTKPEFGGLVEYPSSIDVVARWNENPWDKWTIFVGQKRDLGLLLSAAPYVLWKKLAIGAWAEFAEIFGVPMRMGKTNTHDTQAFTNMQNMLKNMGVGSWGVFNQDDIVELIETNRSDAHNVFDALIKQCNDELAKLILGGTGTIGEKSFVGSAEVHERTLQHKIQSDLRFMNYVHNKQLLPLLEMHGFSVAGKRIVAPKEAELSKLEKSKIDLELLKTYDIPEDYILSEYGTPVQKKTSEQSLTSFNRNVQNAIRNIYGE